MHNHEHKTHTQAHACQSWPSTSSLVHHTHTHRWPASALRLTNGPRRATQDSIHHGCRAMNITQTGTCAYKSAAMRAGLRVCTIMTSPKGKCIIHDIRSLEFYALCVTMQADKVGSHKRRTHTLRVMSVFISTDWFYSQPRVFIHHRPGSHLLPFTLSVRPLIPSIHLSERAAPHTTAGSSSPLCSVFKPVTEGDAF